MRQPLEEPRQVRKEAAVFAIVVCCGVPDLFYLLQYTMLHIHSFFHLLISIWESRTRDSK
jgi:hypothetical protein